MEADEADSYWLDLPGHIYMKKLFFFFKCNFFIYTGCVAVSLVDREAVHGLVI
jgi:hypothetical protein